MGEWQLHLTEETREANVKKIADHLEKFIPPEGVQSAITKFSRNFEQHCWKTARSLHDYERKIRDEMAGIQRYDQLCEENPFKNRSFVGFLGSIKMTYTSRTVAAAPGDIQRDPDDITLEESAKTVLRRNYTLKEAVRKLVLEKAVKKGKAGSTLFNAMHLLKHRKEGEMSAQASTKTTPVASHQTQTLNPIQKKNKNPGLIAPK